MRSPKVYWRWFRLKELSKGWEPTDTGWVLTIAVIVLVQSLALPQQCDSNGCRSKLDEFLELKPSEMGDTLAGLFSALAFIWIIVTVFMQSRELREQRKEFREQRKATQDMARAMAAQAAIFEEEQKQRREEYASKEGEEIEVQLHGLMSKLLLEPIEIKINNNSPIKLTLFDQMSENQPGDSMFSDKPASTLLGYAVDAMKNVTSSSVHSLPRCESPEVEKVRIVLRDLNESLRRSTPATRRRLNSESLKVLESELFNFFGDLP